MIGIRSLAVHQDRCLGRAPGPERSAPAPPSGSSPSSGPHRCGQTCHPPPTVAVGGPGRGGRRLRHRAHLLAAAASTARAATATRGGETAEPVAAAAGRPRTDEKGTPGPPRSYPRPPPRTKTQRRSPPRCSWTRCPDRTRSWLSAKIAWCVRRVWSRARCTCYAVTPPAAGSRTSPAPTPRPWRYGGERG